MSGGRFGYYNETVGEEMEGCWEDPVVNELFYDMFCAHNYGHRYGGLALMLDYYKSSDISEESYREALGKFKEKWFGNQNVEKEAVDRYVDRRISELTRELRRECGLEMDDGR